MSEIPNRADPTSFEIIEMWALREPRRLAVAEGTQRYSYADLLAHAIRFTRHFQAAGIRQGEVVAVSQLGLFAEIVAVLACENLGAVTASFLSQGDPEEEAVFRMADWVVSERARELPAGSRSIWLDAKGVAAIEAIDPFDGVPYPRMALHLPEPHRLTRTSGSTGKAKWMLISRRMQEARLRGLADDAGPDDVVFIGAPFIVNAALSRAIVALRLNGTVVRTRGNELGPLQLTEFGGLPLHLDRFLSELPAGYVSEKSVRVLTGGGFMAQALRDKVARMLRGDIRSLYGTNEAGAICSQLGADGSGVIDPGVDVRIVDGAGQDVPHGQTGIVMARSVATVQGYVGDAQATAESFRDGWFVTGDYGRLLAPRRLQLLGRHDDMLNVGGLKIPAFQLEERGRQVLGGVDIALHNLPGTQPVMGVAVAAGAANRETILARLRDELVPGAALQLQVQFVDALPRTANGKVDRAAVARLFSRG